MSENPDSKSASHMKTAWVVYALLAAVVILILVFVVAGDNEEMLFYGLMGTAVAYVFRPTEKFMRKQIARFTGQSGEANDQ